MNDQVAWVSFFFSKAGLFRFFSSHNVVMSVIMAVPRGKSSRLPCDTLYLYCNQYFAMYPGLVYLSFNAIGSSHDRRDGAQQQYSISM